VTNYTKRKQMKCDGKLAVEFVPSGVMMYDSISLNS